MSQLNLFGVSPPGPKPVEDNTPVVSTKIQDLIDDKGLSLVKAADELGVNKGQLSGYGSGKVAIPTYQVHRLCDYFTCSPNDLYGIHDKPDALMEDGKKAPQLPKTLSINLYQTIRCKGKVNSHKILHFSKLIERLIGVNNPLSQWLKNLSQAVYEVELWNLGTDKAGKADFRDVDYWAKRGDRLDMPGKKGEVT